MIIKVKVMAGVMKKDVLFSMVFVLSSRANVDNMLGRLSQYGGKLESVYFLVKVPLLEI